MYDCLSVCRRSQTAGRNSCSIVSGDVSNCSNRLTVHPVTRSPSNFFIREKHPKSRGNQVASACVYFNDPTLAMNASGASSHGWAPINSANMYGGGDGGVCVCVCVCSRACACVRA